jgi:biopolymer transport protein ExbD
MAGKFDQSDDGFSEINITPFVDVVLVLLVIFMVTAPVMIKESLKVNLSKTLTSDITAKAASVGLAITKEGQVILAPSK